MMTLLRVFPGNIRSGITDLLCKWTFQCIYTHAHLNVSEYLDVRIYWLFITSSMKIIDETVEINLDTFIIMSDHICHTCKFFVILKYFNCLFVQLVV